MKENRKLKWKKLQQKRSILKIVLEAVKAKYQSLQKELKIKLFLNLLTEILSESGCAMIFVSHDPEIGKYFDRKLTMLDINHAGKEAR